MRSILKAVGDFVDEVLALFPAEAGVGDGFAVFLTVGGLAAVNQIRFHHESLDQFGDAFVMAHAVQYLGGNARLFGEVLAGVGVVGVYNHSRSVEPTLFKQLAKQHKVFKMIIGQ